jgi:hypothetical protein
MECTFLNNSLFIYNTAGSASTILTPEMLHCIEDIRHLFTSALIDLYNMSGRRDVSLIQKRSGTLRSSASQQDITAFQV